MSSASSSGLSSCCGFKTETVRDFDSSTEGYDNLSTISHNCRDCSHRSDIYEGPRERCEEEGPAGYSSCRKSCQQNSFIDRNCEQRPTQSLSLQFRSVEPKQEPPQAGTSPDDEENVICAGCGRRISDRFYLFAVERRWHSACLQCCQCRRTLDGEITCFARDGNIYCKKDYYR